MSSSSSSEPRNRICNVDLSPPRLPADRGIVTWSAHEEVLSLIRTAPVTLKNGARQYKSLVVYIPCARKDPWRRKNSPVRAMSQAPSLFGLHIERREPPKRPRTAFICAFPKCCKTCVVFSHESSTAMIERFLDLYSRPPAIVCVFDPPLFASRLEPGTGIVVEVPPRAMLTVIFSACEFCCVTKKADLQKIQETHSRSQTSVVRYHINGLDDDYVGRGVDFDRVPDLTVNVTFVAPTRFMLYNPASATHPAFLHTFQCTSSDFKISTVANDDRYDVLSFDDDNMFTELPDEAQLPDAPDLATSLGDSGVDSFKSGASVVGLEDAGASLLRRSAARVSTRPRLPSFILGESADGLVVFCSDPSSLVPCMASINLCTGILSVSLQDHRAFSCKVHCDDGRLSLVTLAEIPPLLSRDAFRDALLSSDDAAFLHAESAVELYFTRAQFDAIAM